MELRDRRTIKQSVEQKMAMAAYPPRRLALIHAAVLLGAALIIGLVGYYLEQQITQHTGGLSGMGLRSILGTVQTTLQYVLMIARPFWGIGFVYAALQIARGQQVGPGSLLEGFRRWGAVVRQLFMKCVLLFGVLIACMYAGSFLFLETPWAAPMLAVLTPILDTNVTMEQMEEALLQLPAEELLAAMIPYLILSGVIFLIVAPLLLYKYRVADLVLMDEPRTGALLSLSLSARLTKGKRWKLLMLDLSFWWYYLLLGVSAAVSYGDVLLPLMGVDLGISMEWGWLVFSVAGMLIQLAICWYGQSRVETTWAVIYDELRRQLQEQLTAPFKPQPVPKNLPWDDYPTE